MTTEATINDAIAQLEMLGIERHKAVKALSRYNYDVERAADFVFSGNADLDDEDDPKSTINPESTDWHWTQSSSFNNVDQPLLLPSSSSSSSSSLPSSPRPQPPGIPRVTAAIARANDMSFLLLTKSDTSTDSNRTVNKDEQNQAFLVKDYGNKSGESRSMHDTSSWSVIPFTESNTNVINNGTSSRYFTQASLTWWNDPENPSDRAAVRNIPSGLRPPSYNFAYSPVIIQALFHISLFRMAVLSIRPTPYSWGNTTSYWKGHGEPVPGYMFKTTSQAITETAHSHPSSTTATSTAATSSNTNCVNRQVINLMDCSLDDLKQDKEVNTQDGNSDLSSTSIVSTSVIPATASIIPNERNNPFISPSSSPSLSTSPIIKESEIVSMSKDQLAAAELQKLFAFLGNTERLYGSVAHYIRALNSKTVTSTSGWQMDDKTIEDFLDLVIGGLISVDEANRIDEGCHIIKESSKLKDIFLLRAEVDNGAETDIEEIYYLNLGMNASMHSFHDCLDPLVYESFHVGTGSTMGDNMEEDNDEVISNASDDDSTSIPYKLTTFLQIPPLLFVTLENRSEYASSEKKQTSFNLEKEIYMDRYLTENKSLVLEKYQLADQWKADIKRIQKSLWHLQHKGLPSFRISSDPVNYHSNHYGDITRNATDSYYPVNSKLLDKCQLLNTTANYLNTKINMMEPTDKNVKYIRSLQSVQQVLHHVQNDIAVKQEELKQLKLERQNSLETLFEDARLRKRPYDLRAVLHTDGLNGTGHYWGYIWVEPGEDNLLEDVPLQDGAWYRFCDAKVERVEEQDIWNDSTDPFALVYVDRSIQSISKRQLDESTPSDLLKFVQNDNAAFKNEIKGYNCGKDKVSEDEQLSQSSKNSFSSLNSDMQLADTRLSDTMDCQSSKLSNHGDDYCGKPFYNTHHQQIVDNHYQGTQSGDQTPDQLETISSSSSMSMDELQPGFQGWGTSGTEISNTATNSIFTDLAATSIMEIRDCSGDDYRLLKRFDMFLARAGDMHTLAHYYQSVNSGNQKNVINDIDHDNVEDGDKTGDKEYPQKLDDPDLKSFKNQLDSLSMADIRDLVQPDQILQPLFEIYEQYVSMGQKITIGLSLIVQTNYSGALKQLMIAQQYYGLWRTKLLLSDTLLWKYNGLDDLGFNAVIAKYGQICIKKLNDDAFSKATNASYRTRGLQEGMRVARQAVTIAGNEAKYNKELFFSDLGERWLNFTEEYSGSLTDEQAQLLNSLIMMYLDGPTAITTSASTAPMNSHANDTFPSPPSWPEETIDISSASSTNELIGELYEKTLQNAESAISGR